MAKITERYRQNNLIREFNEIKEGNITLIYFNNTIGEENLVSHNDIRNIKHSINMTSKAFLSIKTNTSLDLIQNIKKVERAGNTYYYFEDNQDMLDRREAQNNSDRFIKVLLLNGYIDFNNPISYNAIAVVKNASITGTALYDGEVMFVDKVGTTNQEAGVKLATVIIEF